MPYGIAELRPMHKSFKGAEKLFNEALGSKDSNVKYLSYARNDNHTIRKLVTYTDSHVLGYVLGYVLKMYRTDVITYYADGTITACHNGYGSKYATKVFIQNFCPPQIWSLIQDRPHRFHVDDHGKVQTDIPSQESLDRRWVEELPGKLAMKHGLERWKLRLAAGSVLTLGRAYPEAKFPYENTKAKCNRQTAYELKDWRKKEHFQPFITSHDVTWGVEL